MAIPTYDQWIEPILRLLGKHPNGIGAPAAHDLAAEMLGLTDEDREQLLPSGVQRVYKNRAGWAHDRLKRAGLSSSPRRGYWQLTPSGFEYLKSHTTALDGAEVARLAEAFNQVKLSSVASGSDASAGTAVVDVPPAASQSPDEALEQALLEIRESVAADLLDAILNARIGISPDGRALASASRAGATRHGVRRFSRIATQTSPS